MKPFGDSRVALTLESPNIYYQTIMDKSEFQEWFNTAMRDIEEKEVNGNAL